MWSRLNKHLEYRLFTIAEPELIPVSWSSVRIVERTSTNYYKATVLSNVTSLAYCNIFTVYTSWNWRIYYHSEQYPTHSNHCRPSAVSGLPTHFSKINTESGTSNQQFVSILTAVVSFIINLILSVTHTMRMLLTPNIPMILLLFHSCKMLKTKITTKHQISNQVRAP